MLSKWKNSVGALVLLILLLFGDDAALTKNDNNDDVDTKIDVARRIMRRRRNF